MDANKYMSNITFLRYFYSAAKSRSMTKASKSNFVTQSAISQGIDKLEKTFGKKLLSGRKNRFELSADGELLLAKCEEIFKLFAELEDLFNEKEGVYRGKFSFATSHSFAISLLPLYYKKLFHLFPAVEPIVRLGHSGIVREWVSSGNVEFGIILKKEQDHLSFKLHEILQGRYGIYTRKKSVKSKIDKLIISEDSNEDKILLNYLNEKGHKISSVLEVLSWEVIANMIKEDLGVGILPDYVAKRYDLISLPIKIPRILYSIVAISSPKKDLSRNSKMFISLMQGRA